MCEYGFKVYTLSLTWSWKDSSCPWTLRGFDEISPTSIDQQRCLKRKVFKDQSLVTLW